MIPFLLLVVAVLMGVPALLASNRSLKFNSWLGLRISPVTANEDAWAAGHTAAAGRLAAGSAGALAALVLCFLTENLHIVLLVVGLGWALVCTVAAAVAARKAAEPYAD